MRALEEAQRVDVAEAALLAADAEMQAGMIGRAADGSEGGAAPDLRAGADGDRRHRHVRDAPAVAAHGDEAAAGADPARHDHAASARRLYLFAGTRCEVHATVLTAGERVGTDVEASRDLAADRVGEDQRESGGGDHVAHRTGGTALLPRMRVDWHTFGTIP